MVELEISAITDEFDKDFKKVCEYFSSQDVKYVEIRNVSAGGILTINDDEVKELKDILKDNSLNISCISGGTLKCLPPSVNPTPSEADAKSNFRNWKYNYGLFDRALEVSEMLDSPYIRCFGYHGKFQVPSVNSWENWQIYKEWREILNEMKSKAREKGKMLICENEGGLNKSLNHMERIGKDNTDDAFGLLYDMANVANRYHENGILSNEWLNRIAKYIQYIHAKGSRKRMFGIYHTSYINGKGDFLRWPQIIHHFRNMNAGDFISPAPNPLFLSIETHFGKKPRWNTSVENLKNLKSLLE